MSTQTEPNIPIFQSSYKNQFSLVNGGDKTNGFMENKYSYLNAPTTYGREEVSVNTMHPFNYMNRFKNNNKMQHMTNRRDNTLIIKNYNTNEVGQYAKKKEESKALFEPVVNLNAMAGDTKIVDKISLDRFSAAIKYKTNEYPDNTYVRAEQIDGTPMTEVIRPREKTQEQLRGLGVNSIRLAPEGRSNETAQTVAGGVSTDPKSIKITKYKMKSYREQNSVDDLLRTTGQITRPEWRSMVKQSESERSFMPSVDGPPVAAVMRQTYHNDQAARPTNRTEYEDNIHITNAVNALGGMPEYRSEQSARPTNRTEYEDNVHITNAVSAVGGRETFRNEQTARPTIRTDYENNTNILNAGGYVSGHEYRNEQSAKPTYRTDYENNNIVSAGFSNTVGHIYENNQAAKPTNRTDYENIKIVSAGFSNTVGHVYENNQAANPTQREADNEFIGTAYNQTNSQYKKYDDITRSGVVEEVLARDYMGAEMSFVPRQEDRLHAINMVQNQSVEDSINLTNRDLMGGGTDRISYGKKELGEYTDRNRREKAPPITNRVRNVAVNYIQEIPDTRGYNLLQERSNINQYVPEILNQNPFINNVVYTTHGSRDIIRENTIISDREINRN